MTDYRIDWDALPWTQPMPGLRFKAFEENRRRIRLAEFSQGFEETDWCRKGHIGYVLEGTGELQFDNKVLRLNPGNSLFIPPGEEHRHKLSVTSRRIRIILVEDL